jgi:hypothetical protein
MSVYIEGDKTQFLSKNKVLALKTFLKNESLKENFDVKTLVINNKDYLSSGSLKISYNKPDFKVLLLTEQESKREELLKKIKSKSRGHILKERKKFEEEMEKEKATVGKNLYKKYEKALKMSGSMGLPSPSKMMENPNDMLGLLELMKNPMFSNQLKSNPQVKNYYSELMNSLKDGLDGKFNLETNGLDKKAGVINNVKEDNDTEEED